MEPFTQEILTPIEKQRIAQTVQLIGHNQKLRAAIEAKDKPALLRLYQEMETTSINLEQVADTVADEHEILITIANDILHA